MMCKKARRKLGTEGRILDGTGKEPRLTYKDLIRKWGVESDLR